MNFEFKSIDQLVRSVVKSYNRFIICPFGDCGMKTKEILNKRYGIQETAILDNGLAEYNPGIYKVSALEEMDAEDTVILLNAFDDTVNDQLVKQIQEVGKAFAIANILDIRILDFPEKGGWFSGLKKLLLVKAVDNIPLVRVGRDYDGGYIMLDDFPDSLKAYSFGISNDVSWDKEIASRGIHVYMYDHTILRLPEENEYFHFQKKGIAEKDRPKQSLFSMETILKENGDEDNRNLILKMDVEGAEWDFLESVSSELLGQFVQMTFEWHGVVDIQNQARMMKCIRKINHTHQAVWIHGNNCSYAETARGILVPVSLEITFVRKSEYVFTETERIFPLAIDMPNDPRRPDFFLGNWGEI